MLRQEKSKNQILEIRNQIRSHSDLKSCTVFSKVSHPSVTTEVTVSAQVSVSLNVSSHAVHNIHTLENFREITDHKPGLFWL